jgi:hypothetical protein
MNKRKILPLILTLISCSNRPENNLIGKWNVHHIVINGDDITSNNFDCNNTFDQNLTTTKNLFIQYDSIYLQLDKEQKKLLLQVLNYREIIVR